MTPCISMPRFAVSEESMSINGYDFSARNQKRMRYMVVEHGDLDINNCYAYSNKREMEKAIKSGDHPKIIAAFKVSPYPYQPNGAEYENNQA